MLDDDALTAKWIRSQDDVVLQHSDLALSTLAEMVSSNSIDVAPDFQRRDRWSVAKQSTLIESFLLNLPVPPVYLSEERSGTYTVIDGRQRLTAIQSYLTDAFALRDLTEFPELNGRTFSQLPLPMKANLTMRPLRCATLLRQTDPELKYLVFHRLNTAGEPLNAQEIRNVIYRGSLNDLLLSLASDPWFRRMLKITNDSSAAFRKMQDAEYVLRFLTLVEEWHYFSGDLSNAMDQYMMFNQNAGGSQLAALHGTFMTSLERCKIAWGNKAFRRPDGRNWRDQPLAGLFDAQMIAMATIAPEEARRLDGMQAPIEELTRALFEDIEFDTAVRTGTNTPSRVKFRIDALARGLSELLAK